MTEVQRIALRAALKEVHDRVHDLYPRVGEPSAGDQQLRNHLLAVDLAVHLADEAIAASAPAAHREPARRPPAYRPGPFDRAAKHLLDKPRCVRCPMYKEIN